MNYIIALIIIGSIIAMFTMIAAFFSVASWMQARDGRRQSERNENKIDAQGVRASDPHKVHQVEIVQDPDDPLAVYAVQPKRPEIQDR